MTEQEAYAKGLEKLHLLLCSCGQYTQDCRQRPHATVSAHETNPLRPPDLRKNPAFAWRVLEAMLKSDWSFDWDRYSLEVYMVIDPSGVTLGRWDNSLSAVDALYAVICALGREGS